MTKDSSVQGWSPKGINQTILFIQNDYALNINSESHLTNNLNEAKHHMVSQVAAYNTRTNYH